MNPLLLDENTRRLPKLNPIPICLLLEEPIPMDNEEEAFQERWPASVKKSWRSDTFATFLPYGCSTHTL